MQNVVVPADESDDEYQVIAKKPKTVETQEKIPEETQPSPVTALASLTEEHPAEPLGAAMPDVPDAAALDQPATTDDDWLRSRTNRLLDLIEDDDVPVAPASAPSKPAAEGRIFPGTAEQPVELTQPAEEPIASAAASEENKIRETGRLYLRNLHFEVAEEDIRNHFSKHGALDEVSHTPFFSLHFALRMNVKIGTTDAQAFEVTL